MRRWLRAFFPTTLAVALSLPLAFASDRTHARGLLPAGDYVRNVPGWPDRPYDLHVPNTGSAAAPRPVVLVVHGGGGSSQAMEKLTCPGGDLASPGCFTSMADRRGFVVVYPNGTPRVLLGRTLRTWNAGGGKQGWSCVSGLACQENVDDVAYFKALLSDLHTVVNLDERRIYVTGISNGAAMCHRLACQLSGTIAAIAPVAGGNQFSTDADCRPVRPIPVLEIHGMADPGWMYNGGDVPAGLWSRIGASPGRMIAIPRTAADWAARDGCRRSAERTVLPATVSDGTSVVRTVYPSCAEGAEVVLYTVVNGGHTWPEGWQYFPDWMVGTTTGNLNANRVILDFFARHSLR
jgi:polyhydroxybutyrate depolymerase